MSFASPGPKALHNASTAQEITVITPTAKDFEFRVCVSPFPFVVLAPLSVHLLTFDRPHSALGRPESYATVPCATRTNALPS